MRLSLLFNPFDLLERLAIASQRRRRRKKLRGTPAAALSLGHIDSIELLELLRVSPPAVIYDIGANVGTWTCLAKSLYPAAQIEAFEPLSTHFEGFRQWTAPWPDSVRLHTCALGPAEGTATLNVTDFSDASSLLALTGTALSEFGVKLTAQRIVPVVPLDLLVARENLALPDLIKLDIQGYELEALRGAENCVRHARAVLCEVSFREFYTGQPLCADIERHLADRGFALHALGAGTALGAPLTQADALFIRRDSVPA